MGVVYKAEDTKLRRGVALKFLSSHAVEHRERFLREAQAAAALNHPNICTIYEINEEHGFIAMEFIDGPSVKEKIEARPLPSEEALDIVIQTCDGLHAAHEKGIVHRDIKPANLMLTAQGQVKIMDFGLAEAVDRTRLTKSGASLGTPAYMSPEQVQGQPTDRRTDIWSTGVSLYEMLTGRLPFPGDNEQALSFGIVHRNPEPVTALRSGLPRDLDRVLAKALAKRPEQRYQNIADLLVDLRAVSQTPQTANVRGKRFYRAYLPAAAVVLAAASYFGWRSAVPVRPIHSIAILPLRSLTQEATDSFLGLGIADALITKVGQPGKLRVRPISAVRKYAKGESDPLEVARQLNTDTVLEGSLQQSGNRIRVSMHLRTATGETLWAQSFDVNTGDVFTVQDQIARAVAGQLRLKLDPEQRRDFEKRHTTNTEAFQFYSKALYHMEYRRPDELQLAIDLFKKAIDLDPNYALARAQLGYAYARQGMFYIDDPAIIQLARSQLDSAERIDPRLAQIHVGRSLLLYTHFGNWNLREAILQMRTALRLDPNAGHQDLSYYYWHIGLEALAEKHSQAALLAEPDSDLQKTRYADSLYLTLRVDRGAAIEREFWNRAPRLQYYLVKGMAKEAAPLVEKAQPNGAGDLRPRIDRAEFYLLEGKLEAARREIAALEVEAEKAPRMQFFHHITYGIGRLRAKLGDAPQALHWLQLTVDTGWPQYPMMERDRMLDPVRRDPGVAKMLATLKAMWENNVREFGNEEL